MECVPVRNTATLVDCYYEDLIFEMYIVEAGLRAEEEGYDAVVMDTVSDSGLAALRSRLSIPVLGPGLVSYAVAIMLGKRFSIITMWDQWRHLYEKNLDTYHLWNHCASVRAAGIRPDMEELLSGKEETVFPRLTEEARLAITEDGADVILLGSTTMHQAAEYMARHLDAPVINPGPVRHQDGRGDGPVGTQPLEGGVPVTCRDPGREVLLPSLRPEAGVATASKPVAGGTNRRRQQTFRSASAV